MADGMQIELFMYL